MREGTSLEWFATENWNGKELSGRGRLSDTVTGERIAVIGTGALGSAVSELLVRSGATRLVLVDRDQFEAGNMVRHTLTTDAIGTNKALALATRLNGASPHAQVEAVAEDFPPRDQGNVSTVKAARVIIDCTGKDEVLNCMGTFDWGGEKVFKSSSLLRLSLG